MNTAHMNGKGARSLHAVIVPVPAQGHVTPALQLARKLVGHGFRITFVNTDYIHERMMKSRSKALESDNHIEFVSVSDGLPDDFPRLSDFTGFTTASLKMGPVFEELFSTLLTKSPITCVIRDICFTAVHESARKLGIPVVGISTQSAIALQCMYHLQTFTAAGILPLPPPPAHVSTASFDPDKLTIGLARSDEEAAVRQAPLTCLPGGSPTMRIDDIPTLLLSNDLDSFFVRLFREHMNPLLPSCDCILYNSFYDLEGKVLDATSDLNSNTYALGPLVLSPTTVDGVEEVSVVCAGSGLSEEDPTSLSWLDNQKPNSVIFVSFGSLATISMEQMQEYAHGLEMSGHAFLWVIRPDLIENMSENKEAQKMFSEFETRTRDRALLVPWVAQLAVLSHPSVAAFLTHCGWNSTIESISCGVAMLGWPRFTDQNTNCHYITHVWKIGLELKSQAKEDLTLMVSKEEVAKKVRKIMDKDETDLEVEEIRRNVQNLADAARKAVGKGGSSEIAVMKFIERMERITPQQLHSS